jgi:transposase
MPKGISDVPVFKEYDQSQIELIPKSADELIPQDHLVRIVDKTVNEMDLEPLLKQYKYGGGASRYAPLMMLKIFVYAYAEGIFSSRRIAKALRENIHFMWLSGRQTPDFRTINKFRNSKLKPVMHEIFIASVKLLAESGHVNLENYFLDGTKIESKAGRYTFVWKGSVDTFEKKMNEKLREYLQEAEKIAEEENIEYKNRDLEEMGKGPVSAEKIKEMADHLSSIISKLDEQEEPEKETKKAKKKLQKIHKTINQDFLTRKIKYDNHREIMQDRRSYSKTDTDATFMRMKDDHMRNGQLKPAYNVQVGTENNFILDYSIHSNPTDTRTLEPHLESFKKTFGKFPENLIADAGYGSEQNYTYLEKKKITAYVKHNTYRLEQKKRDKKNHYKTYRWEYREQEDHLICPEGKVLKYQYTKKYITDRGYETERRMYKCFDCDKCPVRSDCTKAEYRQAAFSPALWKHKQTAKKLLSTDKGTNLRKRRCHEVETVFGEIKGNMGFRRFTMGGNDGVSTEWGLHMLAYNMKKLLRTAG